MQNEVLRTLCILSATGAVLTLAVYAIAPLARRFFPARWLKNAVTLVLLAYALPVWLALPPLSALLPARSAPQAQDTPPVVTETVQEAQTAPVQAAADPEPMQQTVPVVHDEATAQPRQFPTRTVLAVWGAGLYARPSCSRGGIFQRMTCAPPCCTSCTISKAATLPANGWPRWCSARTGGTHLRIWPRGCCTRAARPPATSP